ncbi:hypothetical protein JCM19239_5823 [Vibrio variabilis]|uniref:Uncharacterized protein n=1 Tax=Vibrio variabilis TaxID=990271 RepID=A0ABQ0J8D6_9VIBR|nr:hypothetical protein JCM19239_5823 [Vibrio variabilis]
MLKAFIEPPNAETRDIGKKLTVRDAEIILECAIRRCIDPKYLVRKLKRYVNGILNMLKSPLET